MQKFGRRTNTENPVSPELEPRRLPPSPLGETASGQSWGPWIVEFLDWLIKAWSEFEKTWVSDNLGEGYWPVHPPEPVVTQAPALLKTAAGAVLRFAHAWKFDPSDPAEGIAELLRSTRDAISAEDYSSVELEMLRAARRTIENAMDIAAAGDQLSPGTPGAGGGSFGDGIPNVTINAEKLVMGDNFNVKESTVVTHPYVKDSSKIVRDDHSTISACNPPGWIARLSESVAAQVVATLLAAVIIAVVIWKWPWIKGFLG